MAYYLVTGGFGFIGAHLVTALLEAGHSVRVLDNLSNAHNKEKVVKFVDFIEGDIRDPQAVKEALKNVDGCFHLAAIVSIEASLQDWVGTHSVNLTGTINIFNQAHLASKPIPVVYASSTAVYGETSKLPAEENTLIMPLSAYGADKLGCELHARVASHVFKIPTFGLRIFNAYGAWQDPNSPYSGVISKFINHILHKEPLEIFGDGMQTRDFVYIDDVVYYLIKAMEMNKSGFKLANVCTGHAVSINQLTSMLNKLMSNEFKVIYQPPRPGDVKHSWGSTKEMLSLFKREPEFFLEKGLKELIKIFNE